MHVWGYIPVCECMVMEVPVCACMEVYQYVNVWYQYGGTSM